MVIDTSHVGPLTGTPAVFPPGRVVIRLDERHRVLYRRLYTHYATVLTGLPILLDRDFDGRPVKVTSAQLAALNDAFGHLQEEHASSNHAPSVFEAQERQMTRLCKKTQFLS